MESSNRKCMICCENRHKYRCPTCRIQYCSVACYKKHKADDVCTQPVQQFTVPGVSSSNIAQEVTEREDGEVSESEESDMEDDTDKLRVEQLQKLGKSTVLKELLQNPHLRQMITHLDQTDDKAKAIEGAMQEPIFVEFADACLAVTVEEDTADR